MKRYNFKFGTNGEIDECQYGEYILWDDCNNMCYERDAKIYKLKKQITLLKEICDEDILNMLKEKGIIQDE